LYWGVFPIIVNKVSDVEEFFSIGEIESRKVIGSQSDGSVVLVAGTPIGIPGTTNMLRVLNLG
jgi:pyruvate kinase